MAEETVVKVTPEGYMPIPPELRDALDIAPGDEVVLRRLLGGVLLSKASATPRANAEDVLHYLVASLSQRAERSGIHEDEDLDPIVERIQERVHQERYGRWAAATGRSRRQHHYPWRHFPALSL